MYYTKGNYINGTWKRSKGDIFNVISPVSDTPIWECNNSLIEEVDECVNFAEEALFSWAALSVDERIVFLKRFIDLVKDNVDVLAESISVEIGKPLWESKTEVKAILGKLEPSIAAYKERKCEIVKDMASGAVSHIYYKPIGVVAVIGPYNFPIHMANGHIIPALISGNTVIFKPSEKGAMTAERIIDLWDKARLPKGVINLIQGNGNVGMMLVSHKKVNGVFFTGSYDAGEKIRKACGSEKMCALEMGGNSQLVVWDTSDLDATVLATVQSSFITAGQRCSSARRVIVPNNDFGNQFINKLVEYAKNIIVGKYTDDVEPYYGALRSPEMVDSIISEQTNLINKGCKVLLESKRLTKMGKCFISPGIIDITTLKEKPDKELIGPFIKVIRVENFKEAIDEANNTSYGLAAGIFTEDRALYEKFSFYIKAGLVNWNQQLTGAAGTAPFGGVKKSGNYRPSGYFAVDYCVYAVASIEIEKAKAITTLPIGIKKE